MIALVVALLSAQAAVVPAPFVGTRKVTIDRETIRVTVKASGDVIAASKALVVARTDARHDRLHRAVQTLTGCSLVDEMWVGNFLHGKLGCAAPHE